ncbi:hypothetical protein FKW15_08745 [Acetobacter sp. DmW_125133]|nr:hypothetical protein DS739_08965 [Acetobacter sp. JWB]KAA8392775.1 hypothetical protein FKW22_13100 [Acetobacter sp. DmW_125124]KAA8393813.1 hypothetical protein FKW19_13750 [Acetobacter sp. DmW_125128]KAA8393970.1 hypothetical protein FKW20_14610 [Acetobacter sp. DmW_125127]KAA8402998.1 hypothetical protein FKW32_13015 [Acetobacter sp. DmW_125132]KAA8405013.1 hypothetical protein FKW15_08745 [Acetobacter sp. DmW_125133]KAA8408307.1 hypothetical protein FKW24_06020 [Acetobacter sp. DmW_125
MQPSIIMEKRVCHVFLQMQNMFYPDRADRKKEGHHEAYLDGCGRSVCLCTSRCTAYGYSTRCAGNLCSFYG